MIESIIELTTTLAVSDVWCLQQQEAQADLPAQLQQLDRDRRALEGKRGALQEAREDLDHQVKVSTTSCFASWEGARREAHRLAGLSCKQAKAPTVSSQLAVMLSMPLVNSRQQHTYIDTQVTIVLLRLLCHALMACACRSWISPRP
jgi:hypothetical protein